MAQQVNAFSEIEKNIVKALENSQCPFIKYIKNVDSDITIRKLLLDQTYNDEKLNLFIWLILRFEPMLQSEFIDIDLLPTDEKNKKVFEALCMLGLVDMNELNVEKLLLNNSPKYYRDALLIIRELVELGDERTRKSMNEECLNANEELDSSGNGEKFYDLFYNQTFFKQFQLAIQTNTNQQIPIDIQRFIKTIPSETSGPSTTTYSSEFVYKTIEKKLLNAEEKLNSLISENNKSELKENAEDDLKLSNYNKILELANSNTGLREDLIELKELIVEFDKYMNTLEGEIQESEAAKSSGPSLNHIDLSNVAKSIHEYTNLHEKFCKLKNVFNNLSAYLNNHNKSKEDVERLIRSSSLLRSYDNLNETNEQSTDDDKVNKTIRNCLQLINQ